MKTGPKSLSARAARGFRDGGGQRRESACRICLRKTDDLTGGVCTDRQACEERVQPLFQLEEKA